MRLAVATLVLLGTTASSLVAQENCRHEAQRSATVQAGGARRLVLEAGSGSLKVEGKPGVNNVTIRGRACASSAALLQDIELRASRAGNDVVVHANNRDHDFNVRNMGRNQYARLDLVIEVPARMAAEIHDGSGSIDLSDLGALDIHDGSGEIVADNIHGDVRIEDGSGGIRLIDVAGRVNIEDGSGEIELRNIAGAVDIDDGSGQIDIATARNDVRISDASGSIDVRDVEGDFIVDNDGSGSIDYDNVKGRVDIPRRRR